MATICPELFPQDECSGIIQLVCSQRNRKEKLVTDCLERLECVYSRLNRNQEGRFMSDFLQVQVSLAAQQMRTGKRTAAEKTARSAGRLIPRLNNDVSEHSIALIATSLASLVALLDELALMSDALTTCRLLVEFLEHADRSHPGKAVNELIQAKSELASRLYEAGESSDAIQLKREAVDLRRRIAESDPEDGTLTLANEIAQLSRASVSLELYEDAARQSEEAIGLYTALAAERNQRFDGQLADMLAVKALSQLFLRKVAESLRDAMSSIDRHLLIGAEQIELVEHHHVDAMLTFTEVYLESSDPGAASYLDKVVRFFRRLADSRPSDFQVVLGAALGNLGRFLGGHGSYEKALIALEECARLYPSLPAVAVSTHIPIFAPAHLMFAELLSHLDRREEAVAPASVALQLYERLAEADPDSHLVELTDARSVHSYLCLALEEDVEITLKAAKATISAFGRLHPENHLSVFQARAQLLGILSREVVDSNLTIEDADVVEDMIHVLRVLLKDNDEFMKLYALANKRLALLMSKSKRPETALKHAREAESKLQMLSEENPNALPRDLLGTRVDIAVALQQMGEDEQALDVIKTVVAQSGADLSLHALAQVNYGMILSSLNKNQEAIRAFGAAFAAHRRVLPDEPTEFIIRQFITAAFYLGRLHEEEGDCASAVEVHESFFSSAAAYWDAPSPELSSIIEVLVEDYGRACNTLERSPNGRLLGPFQE